jgi:hypothetical protein
MPPDKGCTAEGGGGLAFLSATGSEGGLGICGQTFAAVLDDMARQTGMDVGAAAPDFFGDLGDRCGRKGGTTPSSGSRCCSATHLCVMWVAALVPVGSRRTPVQGPGNLLNKGDMPWVLLALR